MKFLDFLICQFDVDSRSTRIVVGRLFFSILLGREETILGRSTVYHEIVTDEKWSLVNEENKKLLKEFVNIISLL